MTNQPIVIIGAGIAGLTLARCLRSKGLTSVLYDKAPSSLRHSYGITLHSSSYRPILKYVDVDESSFRRKLAVDAFCGGTGSLPSQKESSSPPQSSRFRANRARLESLLSKDLDIRWNHSVASIQPSPDQVTVSFTNGQSLSASFIVAADGVHSAVRRSLLSTSVPDILPLVVFNGKRRFTTTQYAESLSDHLKNVNMLDVQKGDALLQVGLNDMTSDKVDVSYTYSRPARTQDPLHRPDRSKEGAADIPEDFFSEIEALHKQLEKPFDEVFTPSIMREDRLLHWLMRSLKVDSADLDRLAEARIFMLGDAVAAQPILGGEGANAAIRDGHNLAEWIAEQGLSRIKEFYGSRRHDWNARIETSKQNSVL